jgi:hypothetical protein
MRIELDADWFIDADPSCATLYRKRVITGENDRGKKAKAENIGKIHESSEGHYGTVSQACQGYLNKNVASMEGMLTATQIIAAWQDCVTSIQKQVKPLQESLRAKPEEAAK